MEASTASAAAAANNGTNLPVYISSDEEDDTSFPIYISSDGEADEGACFAASYSPDEIKIQKAILLSLDSSRAPIPNSASAFGSSSFPAGVSTAREPAPNHKGKRKLSSQEMHQVISVCVGDLVSIEDVDSHKEKKPLDGMLQELGQCSSGANAMNSSEFYCNICMETVQVRELFPISGCTHLFCVGCVSQYITAKVEDNMLSIGCPEPGCKDGTLHPEACRDIIPEPLFQRWGAALCDSALGALKFYCPFKECSALLVDDHGHGEAVITEAECPHCSRMFCAQCKVAWHDGISCADFQRLGKDEQTREDLLLRKVAKKSKWQRCPKCKIYVERVDGCVFIICRCGHCFCYLCASPMSRGNHCCDKCKRTW